MILMNTIVLALDRYPLSVSEQKRYSDINTVLTWLFFVELIIKVIGLGPKAYILDRFNIFDALITLLTIADNIITLSPVNSSLSGNQAISGLRAVRLFRIFKLARQLRGFQIMIQKIAMSLKDIVNFSILLFLFLFTFSLIGLEVFCERVKFDNNGNVDLVNGSSPRENFDDFLHAFTAVFIILIGDNWNNIMYLYVLALNEGAAFFFIALQIFGN